LACNAVSSRRGVYAARNHKGIADVSDIHISTGQALVDAAGLIVIMAAYQNRRFQRSLGHAAVIVALALVGYL
jgi:hypothetical protein